MMCKNLRKRSYRKEIYFYCAKKRIKVSKTDCSNCNEKEYRKFNKMKNRTSKRSKACNILKKVKDIVEARDNGICIICGQLGIPNSHYIKRSQGGLGIEQNIVCMCIECHNAYDNGYDNERVEFIRNKTREYLKRQYGESWKEEDLYYKKGGN